MAPRTQIVIKIDDVISLWKGNEGEVELVERPIRRTNPRRGGATE